MAQLHYAAKFDPFLSLDCAGLVGRGQILSYGNPADDDDDLAAVITMTKNLSGFF